MSDKKKNDLWAFLASVKLALFTFFTLAAASIIGTVLPQGSEFHRFVHSRGWSPATEKVLQVLGLDDMYHSWWFVGLLSLFSINLIVCTIDRLPNILRLVRLDNLALGVDRIVKMPQRREWFAAASLAEVESAFREKLAAMGWKTVRGEHGSHVILSAQKGAWTRLGVIGVHASILLIFVGAIIGSSLGFKGNIMLPEGTSSTKVYAADGGNSMIPLGFELRCDWFELERYDNGTPKDYRSQLVVLENGREVLKKAIEVNDPLVYKGITFYQSSFQLLDGSFTVKIVDRASGKSRLFHIRPGREFRWPEASVGFGIVNQQPVYPMSLRHKIWFNDPAGDPVQFWVNDGSTVPVVRGGRTYDFTIKQMYATGLQVAYDPGVWWVYAGCTIMLLGLYVAFFMSHRRIWVVLTPADDGRVKVNFNGTANKNRVGFENLFERMAERLEEDDSINLTRE